MHQALVYLTIGVHLAQKLLHACALAVMLGPRDRSVSGEWSRARSRYPTPSQRGDGRLDPSLGRRGRSYTWSLYLRASATMSFSALLLEPPFEGSSVQFSGREAILA